MYRYLIIDDEKFTRLGTIAKLAPMEYVIRCVGEAANGADGLALTEELHPDIIITDMKMPGMGGEELLPLLAKKYPDIYIIVISGYQDFEYSRQAIRANAIDYILKPFGEEEIQNAVKQAILRICDDSRMENQIREGAAYKEAYAYSQDIKIIRELLENHRPIRTEFSSGRLAFMNHRHAWRFLLLHADTSLPEDEILSLLGTPDYAGRTVYLPNLHVKNVGYILLFFSAASGMEATGQYCTRLTNSLFAMLQPDVSDLICGVSALHFEQADFYEGFQEGVHALNRMQLTDQRSLLFYEEKGISSEPIRWDRTDELLFRIETGQADKTEALVTELFRWYAAMPDISILDIKISCSVLTDQIKHILSRYVEQIRKDSPDSSIHNNLNTMFRLNELQEYYLHFFVTVARSLQTENAYTDENTIKNVVTYIDRNYQKNLSVEFVASLFYMNRSYLSHAFKKQKGITFVDYLNRTRIDHAKSLLQSTDKKIYQVAAAVGYDTVRSLYRAFRKFEHTTPERFRSLSKNSRPDA